MLKPHQIVMVTLPRGVNPCGAAVSGNEVRMYIQNGRIVWDRRFTDEWLAAYADCYIKCQRLLNGE